MNVQLTLKTVSS